MSEKNASEILEKGFQEQAELIDNLIRDNKETHQKLDKFVEALGELNKETQDVKVINQGEIDYEKLGQEVAKNIKFPEKQVIEGTVETFDPDYIKLTEYEWRPDGAMRRSIEHYASGKVVEIDYTYSGDGQLLQEVRKVTNA